MNLAYPCRQCYSYAGPPNHEVHFQNTHCNLYWAIRLGHFQEVVAKVSAYKYGLFQDYLACYTKKVIPTELSKEIFLVYRRKI
jgi:hypothetical protein